MKNILRIITVLLIVTVLFTSLTACKSKKDTEASSEPVISETVSDEPKADDTSSSDETTSTEDESPVSSVPDTSSKVPTTTTPSKIETPTQSEPAKQPEPKPEPQPAVKTAQELIIGKWSCSYDCSDELAEMGYADLGGCIVSATVEFTSSGSYVASVNMQNLLQTMRPALEQSITESLASEGKTEDDFFAEIGMTVSEYIDSLLSIYSSGINAVTSYKFEGNTLYIKDTASEEFYETPYNFINDDTLTLNEGGEDLLYTRIK